MDSHVDSDKLTGNCRNLETKGHCLSLCVPQSARCWKIPFITSVLGFQDLEMIVRNDADGNIDFLSAVLHLSHSFLCLVDK